MYFVARFNHKYAGPQMVTFEAKDVMAAYMHARNEWMGELRELVSITEVAKDDVRLDMMGKVYGVESEHYLFNWLK